MPNRLTGALAVALLAVSLAPAQARADRLPRSVQRVIDDFRADGAISPCRHTARGLERTSQLPPAELEKESPDFPAAVAAALEERKRAKCAGDQPAERAQRDGALGPAGTGAASGSTGGETAGGAASPEPAATATPGAQQQPAAPQPAATATPGAQQQPAPAATAATPAPAAPVPAAVTGYRAVDTDDPFPAGLVALGALLALAALSAFAFALASRFGWGGERLARARHAWGEARYRGAAVGADFADWLRLGR